MKNITYIDCNYFKNMRKDTNIKINLMRITSLRYHENNKKIIRFAKNDIPGTILTYYNNT